MVEAIKVVYLHEDKMHEKIYQCIYEIPTIMLNSQSVSSEIDQAKSGITEKPPFQGAPRLSVRSIHPTGCESCLKLTRQLLEELAIIQRIANSEEIYYLAKTRKFKCSSA